jgi:hypothetical protein
MAQIQNDVNASARLGVNYITVDTHMERPGVMGQWVRAIRNAGKRVWFRLGTRNCAQTRSSYLTEMQNLIRSHPSYFRSGDIFDGDAENENSCWWKNNCNGSPWNCPHAFNTFTQNLTIYADQAFAQIGLSGVITWIHSTDPGTAQAGLLSAQTVKVDHNVVTIDPYPDQNTTDPATAARKWLDQLNKIHSVWPNAAIVIGEAGYNLNTQVSDANQAAVLQAEFAAIEQMNPPWLKGWNYWVGAGGPGYGGYTNILKGTTGNWRPRAAGTVLKNFFAWARA